MLFVPVGSRQVPFNTGKTTNGARCPDDCPNSFRWGPGFGFTSEAISRGLNGIHRPKQVPVSI